mgnify:CR=1 FL=1
MDNCYLGLFWDFKTREFKQWLEIIEKNMRAGRNTARRAAERTGAVKKGDGKDIHHRDNNPNNNSSGNTVVRTASSNRSFKRTKSAKRA